MASHPYISGAGNITQMIGFLRKNFPPVVTSDTVRKFGLAPNNESYVINALQFLGLIGEDGKRTDVGHEVLTKHDQAEFQKSFADLVRGAYKELFELRGEEAWTMSRHDLIGYFRSSDKTSEIIGSRQAGVFLALSELAGYEAQPGTAKEKPRSASSRSAPKTAKKTASASPKHEAANPAGKAPDAGKVKGDMALTVRIEINLPAEGSKETYDAIFKSIKANLFP